MYVHVEIATTAKIPTAHQYGARMPALPYGENKTSADTLKAVCMRKTSQALPKVLRYISVIKAEMPMTATTYVVAPTQKPVNSPSLCRLVSRTKKRGKCQM